jgi:hypothetical protein
MPANRVRLGVGKEIELDIEPDCTVAKIKECIQEKEDIQPLQQKLILGGQPMSDDKTVKEYKLKEGAILNLILALRS